jgi:hypothetical protein
MSRIAPLAAAFTLIVLASAMGQESTPAEKPIPFYCPVAGMPEANACCCPGGYCPLKPNARHTVAYKGGKLQMCCGKCDKIFKETPAKFAAVANHQLVATRQAKQVKCPMCGKEIGDVERLNVAGISLGFATVDCLQKATNAKVNDRVNLIFGDAPFTRGFSMIKTESAEKSRAQ